MIRSWRKNNHVSELIWRHQSILFLCTMSSKKGVLEPALSTRAFSVGGPPTRRVRVARSFSSESPIWLCGGRGAPPRRPAKSAELGAWRQDRQRRLCRWPERAAHWCHMRTNLEDCQDEPGEESQGGPAFPTLSWMHPSLSCTQSGQAQLSDHSTMNSGRWLATRFHPSRISQGWGLTTLSHDHPSSLCLTAYTRAAGICRRRRVVPTDGAPQWSHLSVLHEVRPNNASPFSSTQAFHPRCLLPHIHLIILLAHSHRPAARHLCFGSVQWCWLEFRSPHQCPATPIMTLRSAINTCRAQAATVHSSLTPSIINRWERTPGRPNHEPRRHQHARAANKLGARLSRLSGPRGPPPSAFRCDVTVQGSA